MLLKFSIFVSQLKRSIERGSIKEINRNLQKRAYTALTAANLLVLIDLTSNLPV